MAGSKLVSTAEPTSFTIPGSRASIPSADSRARIAEITSCWRRAREKSLLSWRERAYFNAISPGMSCGPGRMLRRSTPKSSVGYASSRIGRFTSTRTPPTESTISVNAEKLMSA